MLRFILGLIGLGFAGVLLISFFVGVSSYVSSPPERSAEEEFHLHPKHLELASNGAFGHFDRKQVSGLLFEIGAINVWNRLNAAIRQPAGSF